MKKYLLLSSVLFVILFSAYNFCEAREKIYAERLGDVFTSGTIEPGDTSVQSEEFLIEGKKGTWFISGNIKSDKFNPERIFTFPFRNYITSGKQGNCYEEFYIYAFPKTNSITVERHIFNFTDEAQDYDSYEGTLIKFKLN